MELAFAGLHALCAPMLGRLEQLPSPQRDALSTAFGLSAGPPPDRFLVGLAVLSLLADAAEEQPLVCIVDDAQWLDRVSAQTLAFVARRLLAERVALVFARARDRRRAGARGAAGARDRGPAADDARLLLDATIPGPLDERVKARILDETRGNPLALIELPRGLTPAELAGGFGLPDARPLTSRIEQSFLQRVEALPRETQLLLLTAAAEPLGDASLLWRAAERLGIGAEAGRPAEAAGLIELGVRVRFAHPLVRSAVYRARRRERPARRASGARRGDRSGARSRPARVAPRARDGDADEAVAAEMVRSADRAQAPWRAGRGRRVPAAGGRADAGPRHAGRARRSPRPQAKLDVADAASASDLLAAAELGPLDELQRARLERLRAQIVFASRRGRDAPPLLLEAARRLEPLDAAMARETYLEAIASAMFAGRLGTRSRRARDRAGRARVGRGAAAPSAPTRSSTHS